MTTRARIPSPAEGDGLTFYFLNSLSTPFPGLVPFRPSATAHIVFGLGEAADIEIGRKVVDENDERVWPSEVDREFFSIPLPAYIHGAALLDFIFSDCSQIGSGTDFITDAWRAMNVGGIYSAAESRPAIKRLHQKIEDLPRGSEISARIAYAAREEMDAWRQTIVRAIGSDEFFGEDLKRICAAAAIRPVAVRWAAQSYMPPSERRLLRFEDGATAAAVIPEITFELLRAEPDEMCRLDLLRDGLVFEFA